MNLQFWMIARGALLRLAHTFAAALVDFNRAARLPTASTHVGPWSHAESTDGRKLAFSKPGIFESEDIGLGDVGGKGGHDRDMVRCRSCESKQIRGRKELSELHIVEDQIKARKSWDLTFVGSSIVTASKW